ncbi:MAG: hypothetical protein RLY87_1720 [Chloroflexota bacterium]|jgi:hypothetical protein
MTKRSIGRSFRRSTTRRAAPAEVVGTAAATIWTSTTRNAVTIFNAINVLFTVSDVTFMLLTALTVTGLLLYYYNAFRTLPKREEGEGEEYHFDFGLFLRKIWRVTEANGIFLSCGLAALFCLEGRVFYESTATTALGYGLFYTYAYQGIEVYDPKDMKLTHTFSAFLHNLWKITERNIFTVAATLSVLLYVSGTPLITTAICISVGFVLLYVDGYRLILSEEADERRGE